MITAAHCTLGMDAKFLSVLVGSTKNYDGRDVYNVTTIKNHPNFNHKTFDYDASILVLEKSITFDGWTKQEITLPKQNEILPEGTPLLVTGWGETRNYEEDNTVLRAVIIDITSQRECHQKYIGKCCTNVVKVLFHKSHITNSRWWCHSQNVLCYCLAKQGKCSHRG